VQDSSGDSGKGTAFWAGFFLLFVLIWSVGVFCSTIGKVCRDRQYLPTRSITLLEKKILLPVARHSSLIFRYEH